MSGRVSTYSNGSEVKVELEVSLAKERVECANVGRRSEVSVDECGQFSLGTTDEGGWDGSCGQEEDQLMIGAEDLEADNELAGSLASTQAQTFMLDSTVALVRRS